MRQSESQSEPFWKSLCQWCSQHLGEVVRREDFDVASLPPHLQIRIELMDASGKVKCASRNLESIQQQAAPQAPSSSISRHDKQDYPWQREAMQRWDIVYLPESVVETVGGIRMERYPTLQCVNGKISTCIVDHPHLAEQMLREQWIRLVANIERRELRSQIAFLPNWNAVCLWMAHRWSSAQWNDWVTHLMARLALVEVDWAKGRETFVPSLRKQIDYEAVSVRRMEQIGLAAAELGRWVPKMAQAYHEFRKVRESTGASMAPSLAIIDGQLAELMSDSHPFHTPWVYLRELPRYLTAITTRLEKLKSIGSSKDQELDRDAQNAWKDYSSRIQTLDQKLSKPMRPVHWHPSGKLLEYRWMIEELRVSVHAQKLGTRVSVSPKRLEKLREQLDSI